MFVIDTLPMLVIVPLNPMTPPDIPFVAGQLLVIAKRGVVRTGQVLVALAVTKLLQRSRPVALKMSVIEHTLVGTVSVPPKVVPWPGSSRAIVVTGVLAAG